MDKSLVAYFSASGKTRKVAQRLSEAVGADIYEIVPETPYTKKDLEWMHKSSRSSVEMKDLNSRPAIKGDLPKVQDYDVIYVGFPIWWYTAPTIIRTFLEAYDFTDKIIVYFATSGGTDVMQATLDLMEVLDGKGKTRGGILMNSKITNQMLETWIRSLQLP